MSLHSPFPPSDNTDATRRLLAKYLDGDGAAEHELFAEARAVLLAAAREHRHRAAFERFMAVEDVVNETLLRIVSSGALSSFRADHRGALRAWLKRILERVIVDELRRHGAAKRGTKRTLADATPLDALPTDDTTPTERARADDLRSFVRRELSPDEWLVWSAIRDEGLDYATLAARLDRTPGSVRAVCQRIRFKLVQALERRRSGERE